jgi:hypothetical protein
LAFLRGVIVLASREKPVRLIWRIIAGNRRGLNYSLTLTAAKYDIHSAEMPSYENGACLIVFVRIDALAAKK